jgi:phospholipase C
VYFGDFPLSWLFSHQRRVRNLKRHVKMERFFDDVNGPAADFPNFCLIEPEYLGSDANDDHPPHDVLRGQSLIARIYNAIRANNSLWERALLVVTYDEHGGFYDHVSPPPCLPPDAGRDEYSFDRLGVRVPALLISPWTDRAVVSTTFDHTSLLKYLLEKWKLRPLGRRVDAAANPGVAIRGSGEPRSDVPEELAIPSAHGAGRRRARHVVEEEPLTENERAVVLLSEHLMGAVPRSTPRSPRRRYPGTVRPAERSPGEERAAARRRADVILATAR